jgi:serine/threonine protein kinase
MGVLPDSFAADPERMARFQREAEVVASLNHPNIAAIYAVEERALVMELAPGGPLKGTLSLEKALNYANQIADALESCSKRTESRRGKQLRFSFLTFSSFGCCSCGKSCNQASDILIRQEPYAAKQSSNTVKHSTNRILTTHAGGLDGPPDYREMMMTMASSLRNQWLI